MEITNDPEKARPAGWYRHLLAAAQIEGTAATTAPTGQYKPVAVDSDVGPSPGIDGAEQSDNNRWIAGCRFRLSALRAKTVKNRPYSQYRTRNQDDSEDRCEYEPQPPVSD